MDRPTTAPVDPVLGALPMYALIDPMLGDYPDHEADLAGCPTYQCLQDIRREAWQGLDIHLPRGPEPVLHVHRLPYLVDLGSASAARLHDLSEAAMAEHREALAGGMARYRIGALIETWMSPPDLMARLQKMWSYPPNPGGYRYLRIADRRVFEALTHLYPSEVMARWLGPIHRWHFLDRNLNWIAISGAAAQDEGWYADPGSGMQRRVAPARALEGARLPIGVPVQTRLIDLEPVSRALLDWQRSGRAIRREAYETAWCGAREANRQGLVDAKDKAAFITRWMAGAEGLEQPGAPV